MKLKGDGQKCFALLLAAKDTEYVKMRYGGYFNVFVAAYGEEGEKWDLFRVVDGEFPATEDLEFYDGFVISGSPYDAYGNDSWILNLCLLLKTLESMRKKVLGICFGHQVICKALGGKVGKACSGWDLGIRKVKMVNHDLMSLNSNNENKSSFLEDLEEMPSCVSIIECHQDEVWEVPLGANVIASSDKTGVEMFSIGDHILGIQGHPEYTKDILDNIIDRLLNDHSIERDLAEKAKIVAKTEDPDRKCLEKICRNFLKNKKLHN